MINSEIISSTVGIFAKNFFMDENSRINASNLGCRVN